MGARLVVTKEISVDASVVAVLLERDDILTLKEDQGTAPKAFVSGKDIFIILPNDFGRGSVEGCGARLMSSLATMQSLELLLPGFTGS